MVCPGPSTTMIVVAQRARHMEMVCLVSLYYIWAVGNSNWSDDTPQKQPADFNVQILFIPKNSKIDNCTTLVSLSVYTAAAFSSESCISTKASSVHVSFHCSSSNQLALPRHISLSAYHDLMNHDRLQLILIKLSVLLAMIITCAPKACSNKKSHLALRTPFLSQTTAKGESWQSGWEAETASFPTCLIRVYVMEHTCTWPFHSGQQQYLL